MKICVALSHTDGNMQYDKKDSVLRFKVCIMNSKKNLNRSKAKVIWSEKLSKLKKRWYHHLDKSRQSTVESPWQCLGEQMAIAIDTHRRTRLQFTSVQVLSRSLFEPYSSDHNCQWNHSAQITKNLSSANFRDVLYNLRLISYKCLSNVRCNSYLNSKGFVTVILQKSWEKKILSSLPNSPKSKPLILIWNTHTQKQTTTNGWKFN